MSSAGAESPRILGIAEGTGPAALSGIPHFLFAALRKRFPVERVSYAPTGARRWALAAATFRPRREHWRARFHTSTLAHRALSRTLADRLAELDQRFDLSLQVLGWVEGQPHPYALYVDQSRLLADRRWPAWMPLGRRERSRVLRLEREMYAGAAQIFTMGAPARDSLIVDYGVEPEKIAVVGGGLSFEVMPAMRSEISRKPVILFVGRDFERKGGDCLVEAFKRVRAEVPTAELHLVGSGKASDVPGVVSWGKVFSRERLAELYRSAGAFCLPSRYEPYGLVLIEAMAYGVPCVGAAVDSIPDILAGGEAGLLVPPSDADRLGDALLKLLSDDALARALAIAGRRRVERELTWDAVAERMTPGLLRASGSTSAPSRP